MGDGLKKCTACKMVKYCNRECQIAHRTKHKKACKKRAAELFDEDLFRPHPPREECPICFLPLPLDIFLSAYQPCCGKMLCCACIYSVISERVGYPPCPFCRTPASETDAENDERLKQRVQANDPEALKLLGCKYQDGDEGFMQSSSKAIELWRRGAELGSSECHLHLGNAYLCGYIEKNWDKANHHYQIAAIGGNLQARFNIGLSENKMGNINRAKRHWVIAARAGDDDSLDSVKKCFIKGYVTKDEFEATLRAHKDSKDGMKNEQRDRIAKFYATFGPAWSRIGELLVCARGAERSG